MDRRGPVVSTAEDPAPEPPDESAECPPASRAARPTPPPGDRTQQVLTWLVLILGVVSVVWLVIAIVRDEPGAAPTPSAPACVVQLNGCGLS